MRTSYFAKSSKNPGAISIARSSPHNYKGLSYIQLAPSWDLLNWYKNTLRMKTSIAKTNEGYAWRYRREVLHYLDPNIVYAELLKLTIHEPILLCWERPGEFCHRILVAKWLEANILKLLIPEIL